MFLVSLSFSIHNFVFLCFVLFLLSLNILFVQTCLDWYYLPVRQIPIPMSDDTESVFFDPMTALGTPNHAGNIDETV